MNLHHYWIAVASRDHVLKGKSGGFAQVCHGKCHPLQRMQAGDGLVYYSPRLTFDGKAPCKAFTTIGKIIDGQVYQHDMGDGFVPYRMNVSFFESVEAPIELLLDQLSFIKDRKRWGYPFRTGHFEIPELDFKLIALSMKVNEFLTS